MMRLVTTKLLSERLSETLKWQLGSKELCHRLSPVEQTSHSAKISIFPSIVIFC